MYSKTIALTGAFAVLASAVPMAAKRDLVWVTKVEEDVVTVPVTTTVWVDPTGAPQHFGHNHGGHRKQTVSAYPSAAPAPSSQAAPSPYFSSSDAAAPSVAPAPSSEAAPVAASSAPSSAAPSPSSVYVAPTTSSSVYVGPTSPSAYVAPTISSSVYVAPTTSEAPSSTSEAAAASASSYSSGSSSSGSNGLTGTAASGNTMSGDFTYYGGGLGACGDEITASDHYVAVGAPLWDQYGYSNSNKLCGKTITIAGADGSSYAATIKDLCPGCTEGSLDMMQDFFDLTTTSSANTWCNEAPFNQAGPCPADGRAHNMKWTFD